MSIVFSDTTNKNGIIQHIEDEVGFNDGDISGDSTRLAKFTGDINNALDQIYAWIFKAGGTWQFDDINHTEYPIITTDLNSGQRDYSFTIDEEGNIILDIFKVMVMGEDGVYREIAPVDQQAPNNNNVNVDSFIDGRNQQGVPTRYDKTANGIFLDPIPNYDKTAGLKVMINREGSYFSTGDTIKKAGFAGLFHYLLVLIPSYKYARIHSLPQLAGLKNELDTMKKELTDYYGKRERDLKRQMRPNVENTK